MRFSLRSSLVILRACFLVDFSTAVRLCRGGRGAAISDGFAPARVLQTSARTVI